MSVKFTQLPAATLPLTGAEILALVQGGISKQVAAASLNVAATLWVGTVTANLPAGQTDNLATDISGATKLALILAGDATLTGKTGGIDGKVLFIHNHSPANTLTIPTESAGSLAENRFVINGDLIVPPHCGALFVYDTDVNRWIKT